MTNDNAAGEGGHGRAEVPGQYDVNIDRLPGKRWTGRAGGVVYIVLILYE